MEPYRRMSSRLQTSGSSRSFRPSPFPCPHQIRRERFADANRAVDRPDRRIFGILRSVVLQPGVQKNARPASIRIRAEAKRRVPFPFLANRELARNQALDLSGARPGPDRFEPANSACCSRFPGNHVRRHCRKRSQAHIGSKKTRIFTKGIDAEAGMSRTAIEKKHKIQRCDTIKTGQPILIRLGGTCHE